MEHCQLRISSHSIIRERSGLRCSSITKTSLNKYAWAYQTLKARSWKLSARACKSDKEMPLFAKASQNEHDHAKVAPLVVVGSANADIYVEVERLPAPGETIPARSGSTLPGGKGANQAACAARLSHPTFFIGQVGEDAHGALIRDALSHSGVHLTHLHSVPEPTGHAVVMLQPDGQNSIIIVGGANMSWAKVDATCFQLSMDIQQQISQAGAVLLQREIPDDVNIEAAKVARSANVPVILDAGGADTPIPDDLLVYVTMLSPNETELARLTETHVDSLEDAILAAKQCQKKGVKQILIKLGKQGSALLTEDGSVLLQPAIPVPLVLDTTGAGDTFTAAFAVAVVEGQSPAGSLEFASAAASLCVQTKGAMPSLPTREAVTEVLNKLRR